MNYLGVSINRFSATPEQPVDGPGYPRYTVACCYPSRKKNAADIIAALQS